VKNKERVKQIFLSCIAIGLIALGYTNYSFNSKKESVEVASRSSENEINLGDVELVSSTPVNSNYIDKVATAKERETGLNNMIKLALESALKLN